MSNIAIKAENLSKAYQLGEIGTGTISRDLERWYARIRGKEDPFLRIGETNDRTSKGGSDIVWSLKDINFEIEQGDAVGIIGRNGAGKSTLLKVLSRVTSPTSGRITGKGRIASLLEVGTGFHPELTGRENIYLNGAILGMRKKEITRKFDEIVDFAGVERYIDTPVKRYSSGMYVRLAFAVAAHLESEILIVDEVLAVGDAEFQKKCLGKMGDVSKGEGRTVLFVSHNMESISTLTSKAVYLKNGTLKSFANTNEIIKLYLQDQIYNGKAQRSFKNDNFSVDKVSIKTSDDNFIQRLLNAFSINVDVYFPYAKKDLNIAIQIVNEKGVPATHLWNYRIENDVQKGILQLQCNIPRLKLNIGYYSLTVILAEPPGGEVYQVIEDLCAFEVVGYGSYREYNWNKDDSIYFEEFDWKISNKES